MQKNILPRIVIVGAGMAGISAACRLYEAKCADVTILEASNRIGGRIYTVEFGDGSRPIELGANWIHGATTNNSTFVIADRIGALQPYVLFNRMSARFLREDSTEIPRSVVKDAIHMFHRVEAKLAVHIPKANSHDTSVCTISPLIQKLLEDEYIQLEENVTDFTRIHNAMLNHLRFHEGGELEEITWEQDMAAYNIPDEGNVYIPNGYKQILEHLIKPLPFQSIKLNKEVVKVSWNGVGKNELSVEVKDGTKFEADHVIVTCSLGYLKKHHSTMFEPRLPVDKVRVINSIGMGVVDKIYLEFETQVSSTIPTGIAFAWENTDIGEDNSMWYKRIFGFDRYVTKNNVLVGWIAGNAAKHMESLPDTKIAKICQSLLQGFLRHGTLPNLKRILVTRWGENPYTLGSYFCQTPNMIPGEQTILSAPLTDSDGKPVLLFAGEAMRNGCTHGARDSGLQAADTLLQMYGKLNYVTKSYL